MPRRPVPSDVARRARNAAIEECLALVRPFVLNAWNGWELLEKLEALKESKPR